MIKSLLFLCALTQVGIATANGIQEYRCESENGDLKVTYTAVQARISPHLKVEQRGEETFVVTRLELKTGLAFGDVVTAIKGREGQRFRSVSLVLPRIMPSNESTAFDSVVIDTLTKGRETDGDGKNEPVQLNTFTAVHCTTASTIPL